ncbi:MAG: hypothetical protein JWM23_701 [Microbacteriaceae bacterium]|nr:hypothetical protein [Microbacteriaceae bacterium]
MDEAWLASLPCNEKVVAASKQSIRLSALLVSAQEERVRLLVWPLFLEFNAAEVMNIEEVIMPPESRLSAAIPVDVVLRVGAPLLAVYSAEALPAAALGGPMPFALATRPTALTLPPSPKYTIALSEYVQRYGLEPES